MASDDYTPRKGEIGPRPIDEARCRRSVWPPDGYRNHQCQRKAVVGNYCRQHDPEAIARRDAARREKFEATAARHIRQGVRAALGETAQRYGFETPEELEAFFVKLGREGPES